MSGTNIVPAIASRVSGLAAVAPTCSSYNVQAVFRRHAPTSGRTCRQASTASARPPDIAAASDIKGKGKGKGRVRPEDRELPLRKQFLLEQYKHLLSTAQVVVFLRPEDFTVAELTKLRVDLSMIGSPTVRSGTSVPSAEDINSAAQGSNSRPRFTYLRAGLLRPAFKALPHLPTEALTTHLQRSGGNVAALTLDALDPPTLKKALAAVRTLAQTPNERKELAKAQATAAASKGGKPSSAVKSAGQQEKPDRLQVIAALVEGKAVSKEDLSRLSQLPSLPEILAQLVGLLETPARSLISMTSRAGGADLVRTLDGFRLGLQEQDKPIHPGSGAQA